MTTPIKAAPQKFRSLEEIRKVVNTLLKEEREMTKLVDQSKKLLAKSLGATTATQHKAITAAEVSFKIMDISDSNAPTTRKRKTLNVDFPVVKVPNAKELMKNYELAEALSEKYKYALNLENEVRMNFAKFSKNQNVVETLGSIQKLKTSLEGNLTRLFNIMNEVAQGHAPKQYLDFVKGLADELMSNRHIECDGGKTVTYAAMEKDDKGVNQLVFAGYIILMNAVSDEGKVAPTLYICVKWTVGGDVEVFVEHEFFAPTLLTGGVTVENLREAIKTVAAQLSLEGFSSQIGNLPVSMQLKQKPDAGLFTAAEHINKVIADEDELVFELKPASVKHAEAIRNQLFLEVKTLLRNKRRTRVRMKTEGKNIVFTFSGLDLDGGVGVHDLDFLADRYKLKENQLRKIINVINGE